MGNITKVLNSIIEKVHGYVEKTIKSRKEGLNLVEECCYLVNSGVTTVYLVLDNRQNFICTGEKNLEYDCGVDQIFSKQ